MTTLPELTNILSPHLNFPFELRSEKIQDIEPGFIGQASVETPTYRASTDDHGNRWVEYTGMVLYATPENGEERYIGEITRLSNDDWALMRWCDFFGVTEDSTTFFNLLNSLTEALLTTTEKGLDITQLKATKAYVVIEKAELERSHYFNPGEGAVVYFDEKGDLTDRECYITPSAFSSYTDFRFAEVNESNWWY